jgi:hypothetical protein
MWSLCKCLESDLPPKVPALRPKLLGRDHDTDFAV